MGTKIEAAAFYTTELEKLGYTPDSALLDAVLNSLGGVAYDIGLDASLVSGKDPEELARVINSLFVKRLGIDDESVSIPILNAAIEKYGVSNPNKYRAILYYMIVVDNDMVETFVS